MVPRLAPCSFGDLAQSWQSYQLCGWDLPMSTRPDEITESPKSLTKQRFEAGEKKEKK